LSNPRNAMVETNGHLHRHPGTSESSDRHCRLHHPGRHRIGRS
jgi:hypothetical protein